MSEPVLSAIVGRAICLAFFKSGCPAGNRPSASGPGQSLPPQVTPWATAEEAIAAADAYRLWLDAYGQAHGWGNWHPTVDIQYLDEGACVRLAKHAPDAPIAGDPPGSIRIPWWSEYWYDATGL